MEVDTGSVSVPEFHWNLKMLLRFGYPEGIRLHLLPSTYRQYFHKSISTNSILPGSVFWEEVFVGISALKVTFIISTGTGINDFIPVVKIRAADNEADHGELADVLTLTNYTNYVALLEKRSGGTKVPTATAPVMGYIQISDVRSSEIGSPTAAQIAPEGKRKKSLDSQTQTLYPHGTTRRRSTLSTSNGESSSVSTRTLTLTPTKRGRRRGRRVKIHNKRKGSSKKDTESESESDSSSESESESNTSYTPAALAVTVKSQESRPVTTATGPIQPSNQPTIVATEVVPNTQPVTTVMVQNLQRSTATAGMVQNAELIAPVVRPVSEQEHSESEPERIPIIVKVESVCENRLHTPTPTPQTIQDFIDLSQDSYDEDENEANHCSSIPVNAGNSTSTSERSSNIHGLPASDNVASRAESVAGATCANIVHAVEEPILPVEFVRVKTEVFEYLTQENPVPTIPLENYVISSPLNLKIEPNQNNGDRQDEVVITVPSVVVKVERDQNENVAAKAVAVPTSRDDQIRVQLNSREPQPPVSPEIIIESRPIKVEGLSAAEIPHGNMTGAETQETAVSNSQTPVKLNLTPAAKTVKNFARDKEDSDPDWEPGPGPSRNGRRSSGNIKRPTAGTPRTPTKKVRRDDNASGQSADVVGPSNNVDDDSREVEVKITGILGDPISDAQFEEIVTSIAGLPPIERKLSKWLLNDDFHTPMDWIAVPVSTTTQLPRDEQAKEIKLRGFYKSTHVPNITSFLNYLGHWVQCRVENFHLPTNTIVYGEFVEQIKSEVITFDVIDCACLLGRDVRALPFEERRNLFEVYCDSNMNKLPGKTMIRLKKIYGMPEINEKIFNRLHTFTTGRGEVIRGLPDPLKRGDYNAVGGIVFFQSTFQSLFTNFTLAMDNRYFWLFESELAFAPTNSISMEENFEEVALWHFLEKIRASRAHEQ